MTAAHTPGPWVATEFNEIRCVENGYIVANVPFVDRRVRGKEAAEERAGIEANKVLLAAAPDLLAALEEARQGLAWYQETYPEAVDGSDDEAMARIDAAIAKATGGAS